MSLEEAIARLKEESTASSQKDNRNVHFSDLHLNDTAKFNELIQALASSIPKDKPSGNIKSLSINCQLTASHVSLLMKNFLLTTKGHSIQELNLSSNPQLGTEEAMQALVDGLVVKNKRHPIRSLTLYRINLGTLGGLSVLTNFFDPTNNNAYNSDDCPSSRLTDLGLAQNDLGSEGGMMLARALKGNKTTIQVLLLSSNDFGTDASIALAESLQSSNTNLRVVEMAYNNMGDAGVKAWSESIVANPNTVLEEFDLQNNRLTNAGAKYLLKALRDNEANIRLKELPIGKNFDDGDNTISRQFRREIWECLKRDNDDDSIDFDDYDEDQDEDDEEEEDGDEGVAREEL